ncbi:MAG: biotin--[acetyl-CoA-carboxylase] ligase [Deltaproteobacteria bacterium]|nr:biotin--[acetyl-CoA-carboxylase] ligase [Deltaproteobacteria bacterium]
MRIFPNTKWMGHQLIFFKDIDSSNDTAKSFIQLGKNLSCGSVIIANKQNKGRGRFQRIWHSPASVNLYFSILIKPELDQKNWPQMTFPMSLGILEATQKYSKDVHLKWPNDILVQGKKICGILLELEKDWVIVGVGYNVNQKEFQAGLHLPATSLFLETGKQIDRFRILLEILQHIEKWYEYFCKHGFESIREIWIEKSHLLQRGIVLTDGRHVTVTGLNDDGSLCYMGEDYKKGALYSSDEICSWL